MASPSNGHALADLTPVLPLQEGQRINARGQRLHTVLYVSPAPRAALVWHHGYGEHVGRMNYVFGKLAGAGISVFSYDAHGHGRSEPQGKKARGYVNAFSDLVIAPCRRSTYMAPYEALPTWQTKMHQVEDLEAFTAEVRAHQPAGIPLFLGGQSMGGLVTLTAAARARTPLAGLVLTSALVDIEWTPVLRLQSKFGNVLASVAPRARLVEGVRPEDMSSDPAVVKDYKEDPLNFVGKMRARTSNELLKAFRHLGGVKAQLKLPIVAVHGTTDHCTSMAAVDKLIEGCASSDKTFRTIEGGFHELLLGPEKDEVIGLVSTWIMQHSQPVAPVAKM